MIVTKETFIPTEEQWENEDVQTFIGIIDNVPPYIFLRVHNLYCRCTDKETDIIYYNDDETLGECLGGMNPKEIMAKVAHGRYNPMDKYFWFNDRGYIHSSCYEVEDMPLKNPYEYAVYFAEHPEEIRTIKYFEKF